MLFASKIRRAVPVLCAALALGACEIDPVIDAEHPDVAAVRLTAGAQSTTVTEAGVQTGSLNVPQGENAVTVEWLNSAGAATTPESRRVLTLQVVPVGTGTGISFLASGIIGGRLTATSPGQKTITVRLFHGDHPDFEQNVNLTVQ